VPPAAVGLGSRFLRQLPGKLREAATQHRPPPGQSWRISYHDIFDPDSWIASPEVRFGLPRHPRDGLSSPVRVLLSPLQPALLREGEPGGDSLGWRVRGAMAAPPRAAGAPARRRWVRAVLHDAASLPVVHSGETALSQEVAGRPHRRTRRPVRSGSGGMRPAARKRRAFVPREEPSCRRIGSAKWVERKHGRGQLNDQNREGELQLPAGEQVRAPWCPHALKRAELVGQIQQRRPMRRPVGERETVDPNPGDEPLL
jgi:hypothetical protein